MVIAAATDHNTRVANQRRKTPKKGRSKQKKGYFLHVFPY